jgi:hypothetical protein
MADPTKLRHSQPQSATCTPQSRTKATVVSLSLAVSLFPSAFRTNCARQTQTPTLEAASVRMATRDRYGGFGEPASTPLQRYIRPRPPPCAPPALTPVGNACNPQNFEPNLALNLEISDMINAKKGTA